MPRLETASCICQALTTSLWFFIRSSFLDDAFLMNLHLEGNLAFESCINGIYSMQLNSNTIWLENNYARIHAKMGFEMFGVF